MTRTIRLLTVAAALLIPVGGLTYLSSGVAGASTIHHTWTFHFSFRATSSHPTVSTAKCGPEGITFTSSTGKNTAAVTITTHTPSTPKCQTGGSLYGTPTPSTTTHKAKFHATTSGITISNSNKTVTFGAGDIQFYITKGSTQCEFKFVNTSIKFHDSTPTNTPTEYGLTPTPQGTNTVTVSRSAGTGTKCTSIGNIIKTSFAKYTASIS
jgi:hypothetical protein